MRQGFTRYPGMHGFGQASAGGTPTASPSGGVPASAGGNAVQGRGIVFVYQTPSLTINHGAAGSTTLQFDNNSTFLWLRTTITYDVAQAQVTVSSQPVPYITLQITDTGNGMSFENAPVPVYTIAGLQGQLPYLNPTPQLIQPNAAYSFAFANYDAAVNYADIRLQLHGFRIFSTSITDLSQLRGMM